MDWELKPCLLWKGTTNGGGYGRFIRNKKEVLVHRHAYERAHGLIPKGLQVQHLCDARYAPEDRTYRRCIEPAHLILGTHADNSRHMVSVGRSAFGKRSPRYTHPESTVRGPRHPWYGRIFKSNAKITEQDVRAIRAMWLTSRFRQEDIAQLFGLSRGAVAQIVTFRSWPNVS